MSLEIKYISSSLLIKSVSGTKTFTTCQGMSVLKDLEDCLDYPCVTVAFQMTNLKILEYALQNKEFEAVLMYDQFWGDKALYQRAKYWWYWAIGLPEGSSAIYWWGYTSFYEDPYNNLSHMQGN